MFRNNLLSLKDSRLALCFLFCLTSGCTNKRICDTELAMNKCSGAHSYMKQIDWKYTKALKNAGYNKRTDLRSDVEQILDWRFSFAVFKQLQQLLAEMSPNEFILCESYSPNIDSYSFVLITSERDGAIRGYLSEGANIDEIQPDVPFGKLKQKTLKLNLTSVPANLENFFVDDGEYYFYIFGFDRAVHQTFCYAPIHSLKTHRFYLLRENIFKSLKSTK